MSTDVPAAPEAEGPGSFLEPGVRYYLFAGFAGLLVLWLILSSKFGLFALAIALVGAAGMVGYIVPETWGTLGKRLRRPLYLMPVLVLLAILGFDVIFGYEPLRGSSGVELDDLLLCQALLAYLAAQYRLFSLGAATVPPDTRPRPDRLSGDEPDSRPARLVDSRELIWLGIILLFCVIVAQIAWRIIIAEWMIVDPEEPRRLGLARVPWRMALLIWLLGVGTIALVGLARILRDYRMSGDEARMVMQDALWEETRGEQRRSARWLAWQRRKVDRERGKQTW